MTDTPAKAAAALPRDGAIRDGIHLLPIRVYYEDTDAGGVVYHANYLKFAERARSEMLRRLGVAQEALRQSSGIAFVVRRCVVDFLNAARLDDDLVVTTRLTALGAATLDLAQAVERDGAVLAQLELRIACIDHAGRPTRLPPELRTALAPLAQASLSQKPLPATARMAPDHAT